MEANNLPDDYAIVCNHCGGVFKKPPLAQEDCASGLHLLCPFCKRDPLIPSIEKGGWHEKDYELPDSKGTL